MTPGEQSGNAPPTDLEAEMGAQDSAIQPAAKRAQHPAIVAAAKSGFAKFDIAKIAREANLHESTVRVGLNNPDDVSVETWTAISRVIGLAAPSATRRAR